MNVFFSLTHWHSVICKVSMFSFEQKKVQMLIPVTVISLYSLFPCAWDFQSLKYIQQTEEKSFAKHGVLWTVTH